MANDTKIKAIMKNMAAILDNDLKAQGHEGATFILVINGLSDESKRTAYISNTNRQDAIRVMKALLEEWKSPPLH